MSYEIPRSVLDAHGKVFRHYVGTEAVIVKKEDDQAPSAFHGLQRLAYRLTKMPLIAPTVLPKGVSRTRFEAGLLAKYGALGLPVPKVLHVGAGYFVMSDAGETIEVVLRRRAPDMQADACLWRSPLVAEAVRALRALHDAGFAHGGAQIRNFAVDATGRVSMFDFEEDTDNDHLCEMRLRDLIVFLVSLQKRDPDVDPRWLGKIYDGDESGATYARLRAELLKFSWARLLNARPFRRLRMKDVRGFLALVEKVSAP